MNAADPKNPKTGSYLSRIRTARSKPSSMTSAEFYRQMEKSMGTKLIPIPSKGTSNHSKVKPKN
jgi:hypothetical protein